MNKKYFAVALLFSISFLALGGVSKAQAAIEVQGPIMDGFFAPSLTVGGGSIIPLGQFRLTQSSGSDTLTKVGFRLLADGALGAGEVKRVSLWKESGMHPGFQVNEDTFVTGAAAVDPAADGTLIVLTASPAVTITSTGAEFFIVATTTSASGITNGHAFHFAVDANFASTSASTGLGSAFTSTRVITLNQSAPIKVSEVRAGTTGNASDEFVELYNPSDVAVDLSHLPLNLHTFYGNGSSTPIGLTYNFNRRVIPAHGFFLLAAQYGYSGTAQPDAVFATSTLDLIIPDGGIAIATSSSGILATSSAIDFVGWGGQPSGNCEGGACVTDASDAVNVSSSVERLASSTTANAAAMAAGGADAYTGNSWDTNHNGNNVKLQSAPGPQNSQSPVEYPFQGGSMDNQESLRVIGSYPGPNMTGVPTDLSFIGFGFNLPVNSASVNTTNVILKLVSAGAPTGLNLCQSVSYNTMATNFEPPAKCVVGGGLSPSTSYVFSVSGVTDLSGKSLDQDSFTAGNQAYYATSTTGAAGQTFTSTIPPFVIGTTPFPGGTNIPKNIAKLSVEFSQINMNTVTFTNGNITLVSSGGTSIALTSFAFSTTTGKYVLTFVPGTLAVNTVYTLTVGTGVKNLSNVPMPTSYVSKFTTGADAAGDTTAPSLVGVFPSPGSTISVSTNDFMFTFDDALDSTTVTTVNVTLKIAGGANLPISVVRYDPASKEGHVIPANLLPLGQSIQLVLGTGIKNVSAVAIAEVTKQWTVEASNTDTTAPSIMFANGNEFELAITFNESVNSTDTSTLDNYTLVVGGATSTLSSLAGQSISYDPSTRTARLMGLRLAASSFTVTVVNIRDLSGNAMTASSFTGTIGAAGGGDRMGMGMIGPGSFSGSTFGEVKDFSASGIGFMPPVEVRPSSLMVNASSTYSFGLPLSKQIPTGGQIVITFPSTSDFTLCCAATTSARNTFVNTQNKDINGPGPGTIGINSVTIDSATKTVTLTLSAATRSELFNGATDTHDFLNFSVADIRNPSIPKGVDSSGYTIDIKSKNPSGALLESFNANPVYIGGGNAGGGATTTISGTVFSAYDGTTGLGGVVVHMMSPQTGMMDATTAANGTYSFTNIAVGSQFVGNNYGGGIGNEYFISTDSFIDPTGTTTNYLGESMPFPTRATSTSVITKNITLTPADAASTASFTVHLNANSGTFIAGEQLDIFAGGPGKFSVQTVTPGTGAINNDYTLYLPKVNGRWGIGIGQAMPKGGSDFSGPPPATNWAMPKPAEVMVSGCPSACNFTVNGASATSHIFTISTADKTIAGKLQDASGNAISGAEIYAYSPSGGTGNRTQSAASGSFEIKVLEGSYNVGAFSPGIGQSKEIPVVVSGGSYYVNGSATAATAETFIIKMTKPSYTITGTVTDGTNPVSTGVYAYRTDSPGHVDAMSDSGTGNYTLYVDSGTWKVGSFVPGFGPMTEQTVTISGASQSSINFSPSTAGTVSVLSGRVYEDVNGNDAYNSGTDTPISGAVVRVSGVNGSNEGQSDSDGNYSIRITSGTGYAINEIFHPTYKRIAPIGDDSSAIGALNLTASTTQNIKVPPRKNVTITVKNTIRADLTVNKAFVDIFSTTTRSGSHAEITNASTTVIQIPASSARYEMKAFVQGVPSNYVTVAGADVNTVITNGTFVVNDNEGIVITVNTASAPVRTIIGQITAAGTAVADAWVQFIDTTNGVNVGAMATSSGWYSLALSDGSYQAVTSKPGYVGAPTAVTVSADATQNLTLSQSSKTITGSVTAGGVSAKDAFVRAAKVGGGHAIAKTDTSGTFTLNVSEGKWRLYASADGYAEGSYADIVDTTISSQSGKTIALSTAVTMNSKLATSNTFTDTGAGTFNDSALGVNVKLDGSTLGSSGNNAYITARETSNVPNTDSVNMIGSTAMDISAYSGSSQGKNLQSGKTATVELTYSRADLIAEGITGTSSVDRLTVISYSEDKQEWESLSTVPTYYASDGTVLAKADVTANLANVASTTFTANGTHFSAYALSDAQGVNPPGSPTGVGATAGSAGSGRITVAWTAPSGGTTPTGYYVYRDVSASGSFALLADAGLVTSYADTTPAAGIIYYYKVGAYASSGTLESVASDASSGISVTAAGPSGGGGGGGGSVSAASLLSILTPAAQDTYLASSTLQNVTSINNIQTAPVSPSPYSRPLALGKSGNDVSALQTFLIERGYLVIPPGISKGTFGSLTRKSLIAFQRDQKIDPIGIFGPATRAAVERLSAVKAGTASASASASASAPAPAPTASPTSGVASISRPLYSGTSGADVASLQTFLIEKGYLVIPPGMSKGNFGPLTKRAVIDFQMETGIDPIGVVGPATLQMIKSLRK